MGKAARNECLKTFYTNIADSWRRETGRPLGKAARNEHRKIIATFYNNIAVGILVAGVLVPALSLVISLPFASHRGVSRDGVEFALGFLGIAVIASVSLHLTARRIVAQIED
jgi:hypothetical protein